jgi:hypothetical protein
VAETVRQLLRRKLSPQAFLLVRYCSWLGRFYLPRLVRSFFYRLAPVVQSFPSGDTLGLADQLHGVNVLAPTAMCRVMSRQGSDKGRCWHNYTTVYSAIFGGLRDQSLRIFELGSGTNNTKLVSSMGEDGSPGASLRGWRSLFPHALIYGADIDRDILFEEDRIKTFYCDQLDRAAIRDLWSQPHLHGGMDIIIDDGLHTFEGNISFIEGSLEHLRPGGFYVVEDVAAVTIGKWQAQLERVYSRRFPDHEFALVHLPNPVNDEDNNLLIIRKQGGEQPGRRARSY